MFPKLFLITVVVVLCALTAVPGCYQSGVKVTSTMSPDVDRIPAIVGVHPLLSSPVRPRGAVRLETLSPKSVAAEEERVYIAPPAETELLLTQQSQVMTDMLSTELASKGFKLKQLPVEVRDGDDGDGNGDVFVMSLSLLNHLQENYDLGAVVLGNVFFVTDPYDRTVKVSVAYLKVVDVRTLDVLAQITGTYAKPGQPIGDVAASMAAELAAMAELSGR
jgi:hypothetical protein